MYKEVEYHNLSPMFALLHTKVISSLMHKNTIKIRNFPYKNHFHFRLHFEDGKCTKSLKKISYKHSLPVPQVSLKFYFSKLFCEFKNCMLLKHVYFVILNYVFQNPLSVQYQLVCVSYHHGDVEEGHYLSNILDGKQWLKVNDCKVNYFSTYCFLVIHFPDLKFNTNI